MPDEAQQQQRRKGKEQQLPDDDESIDLDAPIEIEEEVYTRPKWTGPPPEKDRPRNWRTVVRADARRRARLKANGKPDPTIIEQKRRKRVIAEAGQLAVGYAVPSRTERYGKTDPGAHQSVPPMAAKDPARKSAAFKTGSKRIGVPPNADIAFTVDSTYEEEYAKPPPNSYDIKIDKTGQYTYVRERVAQAAETQSAEFCSDCDRFDLKQVNSNYRFSTDHKAPEMRFSMRRELKQWRKMGQPVPKSKRPDLWRQRKGRFTYPPITDGCDNFYQAEPGLARRVKAGELTGSISYEAENAYRPRFPGCVLRDSSTGGPLSASSTAIGRNIGPGSHQPKFSQVSDVKNPEQFSSMFRSETSRDPLFCQQPKLLLDRGYV